MQGSTDSTTDSIVEQVAERLQKGFNIIDTILEEEEEQQQLHQYHTEDGKDPSSEAPPPTDKTPPPTGGGADESVDDDIDNLLQKVIDEREGNKDESSTKEWSIDHAFIVLLLALNLQWFVQQLKYFANLEKIIKQKAIYIFYTLANSSTRNHISAHGCMQATNWPNGRGRTADGDISDIISDTVTMDAEEPPSLTVGWSPKDLRSKYKYNPFCRLFFWLVTDKKSDI